MTQKKVELFVNLLKKKWVKCVDLFETHFEVLEGQLHELGLDVPKLTLQPLEIFSKWEAGEMSTAEVSNRLKYIAIDSAYKSRVHKPLKKLITQYKESMAIRCIETTIDEIDKDLKSPFSDFMTACKKAFDIIKNWESGQPPILHARFRAISSTNENIYKKEVTPDQAMKLIRAGKLNLGSAQFINGCMLVFEEYSKTTKYIHWFLGGKTVIQELKNKLNIPKSQYFGLSNNQWIQTISSQLGVKS